MYRATSSQPEESHSVINFKAGYTNLIHNSSGSFLSFNQNGQGPQNSHPKIHHQQDGYSIWQDDHNLIHQLNSKCSSTSNSRLSQQFDCVDDQCGSSFGGEPLGWPDLEANADIGEIDEFGAPEATYNKRPHTGESMQAGLKRQCTSSSATRKAKPKPTNPTKDHPQSIAAKNRRERISERLKVLQELVPNGSKVDLVTMLEKAISYVKFLQLQVKVLATDEFWPVQGGKAPDISQVKEAIDAILSSQKDSNSSSK